jgi:hypothetical protein
LASLEKLNHPVFYSGLSGFSRFSEQDMSYTRRFEDPRCFDAWKMTKIKEPRWKKSKPESKVAKTGLSGFRYRNIRFSQNR